MSKASKHVDLEEVWAKVRNFDYRPSKIEKEAFIDAYYTGRLPKDADYSVAQWVEDKFPIL